MKRIAINGFGRIGRAFLRQASNRKDIVVVAINDLTDINAAEYSFKYDTAYGKYKGDVCIKDGMLEVDGREIKWVSEKDPSKLPWGEMNVDIVIEATGIFTEYDKAKMHIDAGAKKVLITGPVKGDAPDGLQAGTVLIGVNAKMGKNYKLISNASCTTNSAGVPIKILDEAIGIEKAMLNTVHAYTATQKIVDGASKKNMRVGRAAAQNIIPTSTGAAIATTKILPQLKGKFDGIALRVPVISGSIADITFISKRNTTVEEVNDALIKGSKDEQYSKVFTVTNEELVSSDIIGSKYASMVDLSLTRVVDGNLVKIMSWYDNEFGFTNTLLEQIDNM